jgi:hypothetical protein
LTRAKVLAFSTALHGVARVPRRSFLDAKLQLPPAFIDAGIKASILAIKARAER